MYPGLIARRCLFQFSLTLGLLAAFCVEAYASAPAVDPREVSTRPQPNLTGAPVIDLAGDQAIAAAKANAAKANLICEEKRKTQRDKFAKILNIDPSQFETLNNNPEYLEKYTTIKNCLNLVKLPIDNNRGKPCSRTYADGFRFMMNSDKLTGEACAILKEAGDDVSKCDKGTAICFKDLLSAFSKAQEKLLTADQTAIESIKKLKSLGKESYLIAIDIEAATREIGEELLAQKKKNLPLSVSNPAIEKIFHANKLAGVDLQTFMFNMGINDFSPEAFLQRANLLRSQIARPGATEVVSGDAGSQEIVSAAKSREMMALAQQNQWEFQEGYSKIAQQKQVLDNFISKAPTATAAGEAAPIVGKTVAAASGSPVAQTNQQSPQKSIAPTVVAEAAVSQNLSGSSRAMEMPAFPAAPSPSSVQNEHPGFALTNGHTRSAQVETGRDSKMPSLSSTSKTIEGSVLRKIASAKDPLEMPAKEKGRTNLTNEKIEVTAMRSYANESAPTAISPAASNATFDSVGTKIQTPPSTGDHLNRKSSIAIEGGLPISSDQTGKGNNQLSDPLKIQADKFADAEISKIEKTRTVSRSLRDLLRARLTERFLDSSMNTRNSMKRAKSEGSANVVASLLQSIDEQASWAKDEHSPEFQMLAADTEAEVRRLLNKEIDREPKFSDLSSIEISLFERIRSALRRNAR